MRIDEAGAERTVVFNLGAARRQIYPAGGFQGAVVFAVTREIGLEEYQIMREKHTQVQNRQQTGKDHAEVFIPYECA
ncbi:MAG TPA: hypothetical protein VMX35_15495 [Acidobacteriota bacterium]|nr:hypothetical protein [Acidobacteriota bacterium]